MHKYYTLIGARKTPQPILELMTAAAEKLARQGWTGRSGGAEGADTCLEDGCGGVLSARMEIYLPWNGFNNKSNDCRGYITPSAGMRNYQEAEAIAAEIHPNWSSCKRGVRSLHTRNIYQVLGKDLDTPSKFCLLWAEPEGDDGCVKGGTGQAVRLCIERGVEIINLYHEENVDRVKKWLNRD
jgi:hypothetical protein